VSAWQLRLLLREGLVRPLLRGVYVATQAPDSVGLRAAALARVAPPSAVITDRTAAWLHGVPILPRSAVQQVPPLQCFDLRPGSRTRRDGVSSGERCLESYDVTEVGGILVTTPHRTALDLGRLLWRFDALAALDGFLRLGVSQTRLLGDLDRFKGYRGVVQLRQLVPLADGLAESPGESALRLHWYDAGLPRPQLQHWVTDDDGVAIYRLDLTLPELRYAAEYDGEEFHGDRAVAHDTGRRRWLQDERSWTIGVYRNADVYGQNAYPVPDLRAGLHVARAALSLWSRESIRVPSAGSSARQL
jgi:hypothetical protein